MEQETIWTSKVTAEMVAGWSDEKIAELINALDDAVMEIYNDIA